MLRLRFLPVSAARMLAAIVLALPLFGALPALAAKGLVAGSEMPGYGRVVFSFDEEVGAKARTVNSVLIIEFTKPVVIDLERLAPQLPNYISVARLDPDGMALRLGMADRFKIDVKPAGEKVYLDLLHPRWQGLPPSLPPEVVQDLVRRARAAEDQLRRLERDKDRRAASPLELRVASAPRFRRAVFQMAKSVPVEFSEEEGSAKIVFDANFRISEQTIRARLAGLIEDVEVENGESSLRIMLKPTAGLTMRGFREDDAFTIDFARADGGPIDAVEAPKSAEPPKAGQQRAPQRAQTQAPAAEAGRPSVIAPAGTHAGEVTKKAEDALAAMLPKADGAPKSPIDATFESGHDPTGFALRLSNLGEAPLAVLQRGKALLVLVETRENPSLPTVPSALKHNIEGITLARLNGATLFTLSPAREGAFWLTRQDSDIIIQRGRSGGDAVTFSGAPVPLRRAFDAAGKESLEAIVGSGGGLHQIDDPLTGQRLSLVPATKAAFASAKGQNFAEFRIEPTLSGFAVLPLDEAITVRRRPNGVLIGHDIKLNLSNLPKEAPEAPAEQKALMLDVGAFDTDTRGAIRKREALLMRSAAESPRVNRSEARLKLAQFYIANGLYPEAKGVLDVLAIDDQSAAQSKAVIFHRALTETMLNRLVDAGRLLSEPAIAIEPEQKLLQALVDAKALRYQQALANFKAAGPVLDRYPERLQGQLREIAVTAAIEGQDAAYARDQLLAFEQIDAQYRNPHLQQLLAGGIAEMQGRNAEAFAAFALAAQSKDRRIEAEARFGRATSGLSDNKITPEEARAEFETLSAIWRRSEVELKALSRLGELYASEGRWRDAFLTAQRATEILPEHPKTRRLEERMGRRFEDLFLNNEADRISKVEALALYQEFRNLVPIGRRGDEIARRLADRLAELDLINEAAEILEHQARYRVEGVARAAVGARLAVMYLQAREPVKALTILRETRTANMPSDLRRGRTLLESRSLGELFRTDLAVERLADESGEDVERLRADVYWKGKKWREAGESYERVLGDAWQQAEPLNDGQRLDVLRAGLSYVLADEKLALDRLRGKFLGKMAKSDDAGAFALITNDGMTKPAAFRDVARSVVNADTLTDFLASYRKRYPETSGQPRPVRSATDPARQSQLQQPVPQPPNG